MQDAFIVYSSQSLAVTSIAFTKKSLQNSHNIGYVAGAVKAEDRRIHNVGTRHRI